MAVDIGLAGVPGTALIASEPKLVLYDDGYYWFLYPLFNHLARATGKEIDLYGDAVFGAEDLDSLQDTLVEARRLVLQQPARWSVRVGTQLQPTHKELFDEVERSKFVDVIDTFLMIVFRSKATGLPVVCYGDGL